MIPMFQPGYTARLPWNKDRRIVHSQLQAEDSSFLSEEWTAKKSIQKNLPTRMRRKSTWLSILALSIVLLSTWKACEAFVPAVPRTTGMQGSRSTCPCCMVPQAKPYTLDQTTKEETLKEAYNPQITPFIPPPCVDGFTVTSPNLSHDESSAAESSNESGDNETNAKSETSTGENTEEPASESSEADADEETIRNRQVALYRSGLLKKGPKTSNRPTERKTSVGDRRVGSATQARQGIRRTTQLVDAVKQRARGISGSQPKPSRDQGTQKPQEDQETKARLATSRIQSTVEEMLRKKRSAKVSQSDRFTSAISSWGKSMGILGEEANPPEGEILSESPSLVVRVATPLDDVDIANLRLSVFSDFSPEMRSQFCLRSCQALAHRRNSGAICVVAKPPAHHARPILLGSAECSYHEFQTTRLGRRRPKGSIFYITEVAVHPSARRQGIGVKLLEAMDAIARQKDVETLYLHVDVANKSAMGLYEKCGYQRTNDQDPIFQEFTTSLNLHPGATRGRTHYLLYKNIRVPTWLKEKGHVAEEMKIVGSLGFEIPA